MLKGKIKKLQKERGFGFAVDDKGESYFFHAKSVISRRFEKLEEGDVIEMEVERTEKGLRAVKVWEA